ncbi:Uncharacterized protein TPAR_02896, partial [Tolypocladium paradoxum]
LETPSTHFERQPESSPRKPRPQAKSQPQTRPDSEYRHGPTRDLNPGTSQFLSTPTYTRPPVVDANTTMSSRQAALSLYRRSLKLALDWAIQRQLWRGQALYIRSLFEANRNVADPRQQRVGSTNLGKGDDCTTEEDADHIDVRPCSQRRRSCWTAGSTQIRTFRQRHPEVPSTSAICRRQFWTHPRIRPTGTELGDKELGFWEVGLCCTYGARLHVEFYKLIHNTHVAAASDIWHMLRQIGLVLVCTITSAPRRARTTS